MTHSLIRGPEDVVALCDIGLLFGGMALFYVALLLVRNSEAGVLMVLFGQFGFLTGGTYGDRTSPILADRLQAAWAHLYAVETGAVVGTAIGAGVGLVVTLLLTALRARLRTGVEARRKAAEEALPSQRKADIERITRKLNHFYDSPPAVLGIDRVQIQRFLQEHKN
jgi:hypothetical protein